MRKRIGLRRGGGTVLNVKVEVLRKTTGSPFVATACLPVGGKIRWGMHSCGRSVGAGSAKRAVAKALKSLSRQVALRGGRERGRAGKGR